MKSSISSILMTAILGAALPAGSLSGETLFKADFDGEPYTDNHPLVTGPGKIEIGEWSLNNKGQGTVTTETTTALSQPRSLALTTRREDDLAQVLAFFGIEGSKAPTSQAIVAKVAFCLNDLNSPIRMMIRDAGHNNWALVKIDAGGVANAVFGDRSVSLGAIAPGTWYFIAFFMPADPGEGKEPYKAVLYADDGTTEITSASGSFCSQPSSGEYSYFSIFQEAVAGQPEPITSYYDNFSIETAP